MGKTRNVSREREKKNYKTLNLESIQLLRSSFCFQGKCHGPKRETTLYFKNACSE